MDERRSDNQLKSTELAKRPDPEITIRTAFRHTHDMSSLGYDAYSWSARHHITENIDSWLSWQYSSPFNALVDKPATDR